MATPERHHMVYHVIQDILELLESDDESAKNFRNVLFVKYDITTRDVVRAKSEMTKLVDVFEGQRY